MPELTQRIQQEVRKAIVGKDEVIRKVLTAILAQGHVLLEDVPGVGKTTMALAFAKTLGLTTKRVQFTSDTMPSDIIGFSVYDKAKETLVYKPGAVITNLLLADEINRTSSKTQSALLESMEERRVTVDGITHALPEPFVVLATQNPVGSAGTQTLPNSQLDRFLLRVSMGYPDSRSQIAILKQRHQGDPLDGIAPAADANALLQMIDAAMQTYIADSVYEYVSELVEATRKNPFITLGVSPRGMLALCRAAKAWAYLDGRDYVAPQDIAAVYTSVCAHRIVLSPRARLNELTASALLEQTLGSVKKPDGGVFAIR